ncbi:unnamed protein product [Adineta steineri]|uniref:Uncharacterized protein n=1 Tax=Adineta steineri TaxID=433720 RepID=A0A813XCD3_9BILA|nr:unnamed protein product [Adineta steineri]
MTSTTEQIGLVDINDNDSGEGLILVIIVTGAFLVIILVTCGIIIYYYYANNESKNKELYKLKHNYQRQINRNISNMLTSMHNITDLQTKFNQREQEISQLKHNEEKRLQFLRTAMLDYIGRDTKSK